MIKQESSTKANGRVEKAEKETMGLIDIGLPQGKKLKLTLIVRTGSKVEYNEGKYKLTNYMD